MDNLQQQIDNLRTLQQSYDQLATAQASLAADVQAIKDAHILEFDFGGCVFNIQVEDAAQAIAYADTNCVRFEDDKSVHFDKPTFGASWVAIQEISFPVLKRLYESGAISFFESCYTVQQIDMPQLEEIIRHGSIFSSVRSLEALNIASLYKIEVSAGNLYFCSNASALSSITANLLHHISLEHYGTYNLSEVLTGLSSLQQLSMPKLTSIYASGGYTTDAQRSQMFTSLSSLTQLSLPSLVSIISTASQANNNSKILTDLSALQELSLPNLTTIQALAGWSINSSSILSGLQSLTKLCLPSLTTVESSVRSGGTNTSSILSGAVNLTDIEIGHSIGDVGSLINNMDLRGINPTSVYQDAEKLAELNANIRTKFFANLFDYSGGTAHTLTLNATFVSYLESATIQVATDKNWTIVTA